MLCQSGQPGGRGAESGPPDDFAVAFVLLAFMAAGATGLVVARKQGKRAGAGSLWAPAAMPAAGVTTLGRPLRRDAGNIGLGPAQPAGPESEGAPVELKPPVTRLGYAVKGLVFTILS